MNALITGATGFIGSHLTRRLVNIGWQVHAVIRRNANLHLIHDILESINLHEHDGSTESMNRIIQAAQPDIVFHLAAFSITNHKSHDIVPMLESNIIFGTQLVQAMVDNSTPYMVNTGTCLQHFDNREYSPTCLYAATKQAFEDILMFYTETTLLKVITLKLFNSYGPNDPRPRIMTLLQKAAEENLLLKLSPGEQFIDFVYIDDIIDAYMIAAFRLIHGQSSKVEQYSISSQAPITLRNLVNVFETVTGKKLQIQWGAIAYQPRESMVPWSTGDRLPLWQPKISLEEGIRRLMKEGM